MKKTITFIIAIIIASTAFAQTYTEIASAPSGARINYASCMLNDGRIIIIGGYFGTNIIPKPDIYNTETDTWVQGADMPTPVASPAIVCSSDSTVLVFGGIDLNLNETTNQVWEYNVNQDIWKQKTSMPEDCREHIAVVLPDNRVFIAGGYKQPSDEDNIKSFIYNPFSDNFETSINMLSPRTGASAHLLNSGEVIIFGGIEGYNVSNKSEIFDPQTNTWREAGNLPTIRSGGQRSVKLSDGRIFCVGGANWQTGGFTDNIEVFDPENETWSVFGNLSYEIASPALSILPNGNIMAVGGHNGSKNITNSSFDGRKYPEIKTGKGRVNNAVEINTGNGTVTDLTNYPESYTGIRGFTLKDQRSLFLFGYDTEYSASGYITGDSQIPLTYQVQVEVTQSDGATPIENAVITVQSLSYTTDNLGVATLEVISGNGISLSVTAENYIDVDTCFSMLNFPIQIEIQMQQAVGLENIYPNISVYPNPTTGIVNLSGFQSTDAMPCVSTVKITDITGKQIHAVETKCIASLQQVDLSEMEKGVYFIKIEKEGNVYTQKIVKF